ncbi:major capsid protein [Agrobacterium fabrum]|uniref:major capsid protein n=1 Tax=Agrobacterium fabrum TaxID=1176649 RepID=UPI003B9EC4F4
MTPLNINTARMVDPILSGVALGYRQAHHVGLTLFPRIEVPQSGGKIIEFGRESFIKYQARRAPGAAVKQITFGYEGKPYALSQDALDVPVPREFVRDASTVPGIDLGKRATMTAMEGMTLALEIEQAELATTPANYGNNNKLALSGSSVWTDPSSDPLGDIEQAKDQVRMTSGIEPNRMVIASKGFKALKNHPKIVERFKYTSSASITTEMLAALLELEMLSVGKATYTESADKNELFKEAWGNAAVLAYVPTQNEAMEQPSFGYTYMMKGNPFVEVPRWDGGTRSWIYGVTYERAPVLTGIASGFLFSGVAE